MAIKVLYVQTDWISMRDLPEAFAQLGYDVVEVNYSFSAQKYKQEECDALKEIIGKNDISHVITYDFIECVAQACYEVGSKYISWVYDCPQKELFTKRALYPSNYIFVFDKMQKNELEQIGVKKVFHTPLAVSKGKIENVLNKSGEEYIADISFVGQLYGVNGIEKIMAMAPASVQDTLIDTLEHFFINWKEDETFGGYAADTLFEYLDLFENHKLAAEAPLMKTRRFYESAFLARMLAREERTAIVNDLAKKYKVNLYTRNKDLEDIEQNVHIIDGVGYDKAVYKVYRNSKINLNITLHCIESGVSQRIFDVLAAGGFLITNYQKELEDFFEIGRDLVVYHNYSELVSLVDYYMNNEDERKEIANNGRKKVLGNYTYEIAVRNIMRIIAES